MPLKFTACLTALLIFCSLSLQAGKKSDLNNEKNEQDKSKKIITFDSCKKGDTGKCKKEKGILSPDYSKDLK